jgi:hypothetical protein
MGCSRARARRALQNNKSGLGDEMLLQRPSALVCSEVCYVRELAEW